ncbi:hypothetical protein EDD15DRAFT_2375146 [Pisolithus albus]|nr:hypothetical protein EDD15DRAFT_2375146 [Pisolithus albus]
MSREALPSTTCNDPVSSINLRALVSLIRNLELTAADAATLASVLLARSRTETHPECDTVPSFPSSPTLSPSHVECEPLAESSLSFPVFVECPTPPVSIHLTPPDHVPPIILVHGRPDSEAVIPSFSNECFYTPGGLIFTVSL